MLTSITPLGERGRGHRWSTTSAWLVVGHLFGGLILGAILAAFGVAMRRVGVMPSDRSVTAAISVAVVAAAAFDLIGFTVPGRRQVDERWLTSYRGWVYGAGFGLQLGFGLVTVVNTALVGSVLVAGVLLPGAHALVVGVAYGMVRGIAATANGWVRSVGDLHRLHRWLDAADCPARWIGATVAAAFAIAAATVA